MQVRSRPAGATVSGQRRTQKEERKQSRAVRGKMQKTRASSQRAYEGSLPFLYHNLFSVARIRLINGYKAGERPRPPILGEPDNQDDLLLISGSLSFPKERAGGEVVSVPGTSPCPFTRERPTIFVTEYKSVHGGRRRRPPSRRQQSQHRMEQGRVVDPNAKRDAAAIQGCARRPLKPLQHLPAGQAVAGRLCQRHHSPVCVFGLHVILPVLLPASIMPKTAFVHYFR